jgi:hypothetical protein
MESERSGSVDNVVTILDGGEGLDEGASPGDQEIITNYEIIEYEGEQCRFYPQSGAVMSELPSGKLMIVANLGGRPDFDGKEMVAIRELKKEQAILDGLRNAAEELDLRGASAMLSAIVAARAKNAVEDEGRTGSTDAKFIFSLVRQDREGEEEDGPALRIDMDQEVAEALIRKLVDL